MGVIPKWQLLMLLSKTCLKLILVLFLQICNRDMAKNCNFRSPSTHHDQSIKHKTKKIWFVAVSSKRRHLDQTNISCWDPSNNFLKFYRVPMKLPVYSTLNEQTPVLVLLTLCLFKQIVKSTKYFTSIHNVILFVNSCYGTVRPRLLEIQGWRLPYIAQQSTGVSQWPK